MLVTTDKEKENLMETHVQCKNRLLNKVRHIILTTLNEDTKVYFSTYSGHQYLAQYDGYYWYYKVYRSNRGTVKDTVKHTPVSPFAFYRMLQEPCVRSITILSPGLVIDINPGER